MELSEIWLKIARQEKLSPQELDFLERSGKETQQRNNFIAGNTTADNRLSVNFPFTPFYSETLEVNKSSISVVIPSGYKHLMVYAYGRGTGATTSVVVDMQFNLDTGSNYTGGYVHGHDAATVAGFEYVAQTNIIAGFFSAANATAGSAGALMCLIPNYSSNTLWKTGLVLSSSENYLATNLGQIAIIHGVWRNTSAINTITFALASGNILAGSVFSVYGIL